MSSATASKLGFYNPRTAGQGRGSLDWAKRRLTSGTAVKDCFMAAAREADVFDYVISIHLYSFFNIRNQCSLLFCITFIIYLFD